MKPKNPADEEADAVRPQCLFPDGTTRRIIVQKTKDDVFMPSTIRTRGSNGAHIKIDIGETVTVTNTVSASISAEATAVFAKASATIGTSASISNSAKVTRGGDFNVPQGQTWDLVAGMDGKAFKVRIEDMPGGSASCSPRIKSGTGKAVSKGNLLWFMPIRIK